MATTQCPACGLAVPYFCCEGLVCPACGYDEEQHSLPGHRAAQEDTPRVASRSTLPAHSRASQPPVP
jgi:uncharacterized Zn finger protein (UPF0148 family)